VLTKKQAKIGATGFANDVISKGCMYANLPNIEDHNWSKGEPMTLYTIAMFTINQGVEGVSDKVAAQTVIEHLEDTFPQYLC